MKLAQLFDVLWPRLESKLSAIPSISGRANPTRSQGEILEELVSIVRAMDQRTSLQEEHLSLLTRESWDEEVRSLLLAGEKLKAIKILRDHVGIGLKQAKDFVEAWQISLERKLQEGSQMAGETRQEAVK